MAPLGEERPPRRSLTRAEVFLSRTTTAMCTRLRRATELEQICFGLNCQGMGCASLKRQRRAT